MEIYMPFNNISVPEVKVCGTLFNVDFCIVLTFEIGTEDPAGLISVDDFLDEFETHFFAPGLLNYQTSDLLWNKIEVRDLRDKNTFAVRSVSVPGNTASDPLPAFMAMGFKKDIQSRITRPGSTRIPGLVETNITNGQWNITQDTIDWGEALRAFVWSNGGGYTNAVNMVVVGSAPDGDYDLNRINTVSAFRPIRVTTQNSRKS